MEENFNSMKNFTLSNRKLGKGSFAEVFKVRSKKSGVTYAVKEVR